MARTLFNYEDMAAQYALLAVDDETLNGELMRRVFRDKTLYDLKMCTSPLTALELVKNVNFDLVLLDQTMPEMSGIEFIRQVHAHGKRPLFVMVTAFPEMMEVINAWKSGLVQSIITKPWRAGDLVTAVEQAIAKQK